MTIFEQLTAWENDDTQTTEPSATELEHGALLRVEFAPYHDIYIYTDGFKECVYIGD